MSDRLFQIEQELQRLKAQGQSGLSAAQAYEDTPQTNRLLALEQSVTEATEDQPTANSYAASLSQSDYSQTLTSPYSYTYVIDWRKVPDGVAIHKSLPGFTETIVRSGGILKTGIATRAPVGAMVKVDWTKVASGANYVWCKYNNVEGYIRRDHIFDNSREDMLVWRILNDDVLLEGFTTFATLEFSDENLYFLRDYQNFEEFDDSNLGIAVLVFPKASALVQQYMLPNAPKLVNVNNAEQFRLAHAAYNDPANTRSPEQKQDDFLDAIRSPLREAKQQIEGLVRQDTCRRFFLPGSTQPHISNIQAVQRSMTEKAQSMKAAFERRRDEIIQQSLKASGFSLAESTEYGAIENPYTTSLSSRSLQPVTDSFKATYVIVWEKPRAAIHKFDPGSGSEDIVKSGGIFGDGIHVRVPIGTIVEVNWNKKSSGYVQCRFEGVTGYIRENYVFDNRVSGSQLLQKVLAHPVMTAVLRDHLKLEFSTENLDFVLACRELEKLAEASGDTDDFLVRMFEVVKEYTLDGSPQEINIPHSIKKGFVEAYDALGKPKDILAVADLRKTQFKNAVRSQFELAQKEIIGLILKDSFRRFEPKLSEPDKSIVNFMQAAAERLRADRIGQSLKDAGIL